MNIVRGSIIGLAGVVGAGLLAWPAITNADTPDDGESYKRDERSTELSLVEDDDDQDGDDTRDDRVSRDQNTRTQNSSGAVDVTDDVTNDVTDAGTRNTADRSKDVTRDVSRDDTNDDTNGATNDDTSSRDDVSFG